MKEIVKGVYYCGLHDKTRKVFDQLVPLPQGTTYNSYLVKGSQKTALIDTMYHKLENVYVDMIEAFGAKVDYIIANHAEPDHTGAIPKLLMMFPDATIYCSVKCAENLQNMLHVDPKKINIVSDTQELSLGDKTLRFTLAPWVHWPDTMFTHLVEDNLLFTCDFLGAHYTKNEVFADNSAELAEAAKRYYSEIMMPFRTFCVKYLAKIDSIKPKMVLPSHGPVYTEPDFILNLYKNWTSPNVSKKVVILYVSMYDNSKIMVEYLENLLSAKNIEIAKIDLMELDEGELAMELIDAETVVFGTSMVLTGPHPKSVYAAYFINILRPKLKYFAIVGSYGWAGNLSAPIRNMFTITKPKELSEVIAKGKPTQQDFDALENLASQIIECS